MNQMLIELQPVTVEEDLMNAYVNRNKSLDAPRHWFQNPALEQLADWWNEGLIGEVDCDLILQGKTIW